ncbi:MAG: hypothetical protein D6798_03795, partial [Deltaproteobacteria bacterium]
IEEGLRRFPDDPDLRFNRAALRARLGDLDGAAADLHALIGAGLVSPEEAAADPDLVLLRGRPDLAALVPGPVLAVDLHGEEGSVLLGEEYRAELYLDMPADRSDLAVRSLGEPTGLLRRQRVVEDHLSRGSVRIQARIAITWRAVAAGRAEAGPWLFTAGGVSALTDRMPVEVVAVGELPAAQESPGREDLVVPSAVVGDRLPPWAGPIDGRLGVLVRPDDVAEVTGAEGVPLSAEEQWELRRSGQTEWVVRLYDAPQEAWIRVRRGDVVVLEQQGARDPEGRDRGPAGKAGR